MTVLSSNEKYPNVHSVLLFSREMVVPTCFDKREKCSFEHTLSLKNDGKIKELLLNIIFDF